MTQNELYELLENMSLKEKIGQLLQLDAIFFTKDVTYETGPASNNGYTTQDQTLCGSVLNIRGANTVKQIQKSYIEKHPHKIPLLFMLDVINGYRTVFPIPLAQGCSFSPEIVKEAASISAAESATDGIFVDFSPMSDLVSDCRWGRVMESFGEDPYLNSRMTRAIIHGYQGEDPKNKNKLAACMKHFAGYGSPLSGREYNTAEFSERTLFEEHMPAYETAIKEGCKLVMTSFNTVDRIPSTANKHLIKDILRNRLAFHGVVISDYSSVVELVNHGIASDHKAAAQLAMNATVDIDMCSDCYIHNLEDLVLTGQVSMQDIDNATLRVLSLKNDLGLFENPYKDADESEHKRITLSEDHRKIACKFAQESFVLLKNENDCLPLNLAQHIGFIGPYVTCKELHGCWSLQADSSDNVSIQEALDHLHANYVSAEGCPILQLDDLIYGFGDNYTADISSDELETMYQQAVELAANVSKVVLCLGEHRAQTGEGGSRVNPSLPEVQLELLRRIHTVNKNIILVLFSGRPLILTEIESYCQAILCVWFPGTEAGNAIASVLYGNAEPGGRLSMCFPRHVGQLPLSYRQLRTGRPYNPKVHKTRFVSRYQDCLNTPLYPFGFGLGYTNFDCSPIHLDRSTMTSAEIIHATVTVTNCGKRPGKQIVQMYLSDPYASVCRPERELKGFQTIVLNPDESIDVTFELTESMMKFYDINMEYQSEPGEMIVYIGFDSSCENSATFELL